MIVWAVIIILRDLGRLGPLEWVVCERLNDANLLLNGNDDNLLGVVREGERGNCQYYAGENRRCEIELSLLTLLALNVVSHIAN